MVVLAIAAVVIASSFATPAAEQAPSAKPQVRVATLRPFIVVGTGFRAGEAVRVSVRADNGAASDRDIASRRGGIDVRFSGLKLGRCPTYVVTARGSEGSRATVRSFPGACGIDPGPSR